MSRPRRRRQADLDDRDRLEHAVDEARSCNVGRGRARSRSACRRAARRASCAPRTAASPPTRSSASRSGSACRTSARLAPRARVSGCTAATARPSPPRRRSAGSSAGSGRAAAAAATSTARRRRSRCSRRATAQRFRGKLSGARARVRQPRRERHRAHQLALDGQHVRSWGGSGGSIDPWWGSADWKPRPPHAHVQRARLRAERDAVSVQRREAAPPLKRTAGGVPITGSDMRLLLRTLRSPCCRARARRPRAGRRDRRQRDDGAEPSDRRDRARTSAPTGSALGHVGGRGAAARAASPRHYVNWLERAGRGR